MKAGLKNKSGFTVLELIVVIAIIGVLAAILIPCYIGYNADAQKSTCSANRATILRCVVYEVTNDKTRDHIKNLASSPLVDFEPYFEADELRCPSGGHYEIIPYLDEAGNQTMKNFIFCDCPYHHDDYTDELKAAVDAGYTLKGMDLYDWSQDAHY